MNRSVSSLHVAEIPSVAVVVGRGLCGYLPIRGDRRRHVAQLCRPVRTPVLGRGTGGIVALAFPPLK